MIYWLCLCGCSDAAHRRAGRQPCGGCPCAEYTPSVFVVDAGGETFRHEYAAPKESQGRML